MQLRTLQKLVKYQLYFNKIFAIHLENMATFEWLAFLPHNVFYGIYKQGLTTAANQLKWLKLTPEITLFVVIMKNPTCFVSVNAQKLIPPCIPLNSRGHCCSLFCFSSSCFNVPEHEAFLTLSQDRQFDNLMLFISTVKKKK